MGTELEGRAERVPPGSLEPVTGAWLEAASELGWVAPGPRKSRRTIEGISRFSDAFESQPPETPRRASLVILST